MVTIGKCQLPELLQKRGMTQRQLSDAVDMSHKQISDYVHGRRVMSLRNAKLISGALRCRMEDLYEWIYMDNEGVR